MEDDQSVSSTRIQTHRSLIYNMMVQYTRDTEIALPTPRLVFRPHSLVSLLITLEHYTMLFLAGACRPSFSILTIFTIFTEQRQVVTESSIQTSQVCTLGVYHKVRREEGSRCIACRH